MADVEVGSKRSSSNYDDYADKGGQKRSRGEAPQMRLLVSGKSCGAVIGRAGENIKKLRQEYGIKIKVEDSRPDGCITLIGDKSACVSVFKEILPSLKFPPFSVNAQNRCESEINLLVQNDRVGAVIGKSGQKIKEIQDETGAKVRVYPDVLPNSDERVVAIGGESESTVLTSVEVILEALEGRPARRQPMYYDPKNKDTNGGGGMQRDGGGLGGGQLGLDENNMNQADVAQSQLAALNALGLGGLAGLGGLGGLGGGAGLLGGLGGLGSLGNMGGGNDMGAAGGAGGYQNDSRDRRQRDSRSDDRDHRGQQRGGDNERRQEFGDMETETKITVLNDMIGVIIGKGGENVKEIRRVSGAKVDFSQTERGSKEPRIVTIKGTQKQIVIAQQMMAEFIHNRH